MNERIKELAFEAKLRAAILLHHYGNIDTLTDSEQESLKQMEKFAELIVRDCINIVERHGSWIGVDYIKEHFGVEE